MTVEFELRRNQAPTPTAESSGISPESLVIPKFYSALARRPLPPIIDKMVRQANFQIDRIADAHPVIDPEETSRKKRAESRRPIARSARELPKAKAIELGFSHYLEPDDTRANVFIAAEDVSEICEIIRMSRMELDDETEDPEVVEVLNEDQALYEHALTSEEPDTLELSLRGRVIEYVEKLQVE